LWSAEKGERTEKLQFGGKDGCKEKVRANMVLKFKILGSKWKMHWSWLIT
jgi:hypothetical protein